MHAEMLEGKGTAMEAGLRKESTVALDGRSKIITVRDLIESLKRFNPDATVGCLAACCSHPHPIKKVRKPDEFETARMAVVIDARE